MQENATISKMEIVQTEGNREVSREVKQYNLEMLIALGYRIRSKVATKFLTEACGDAQINDRLFSFRIRSRQQLKHVLKEKRRFGLHIRIA